MGILDNVLRPHLEAVTKAVDTDDWRKLLSMQKATQNDTLKSKLNVKWDRSQAAVSFREQGNEFFKVGDFPNSQRFYSESIAAALEGPLASLAYFNRFFPIYF
jgi:hypothetical protein